MSTYTLDKTAELSVESRVEQAPLSEVRDVPCNNFDFLRFAAATSVTFSHSWDLLRQTAHEPLFHFTRYPVGLKFSELGLYTFFIISGFLITKSWVRKPNPVSFFKNRFLRLVPGLAVVTFLCVFVVGQCFTSLNLNAYWHSPQTWLYFKNISVAFIDHYLPGVFQSNPLKGSINGSVWTLPSEFMMYMTILVLGCTRLLSLRSVLVLAAVAMGFQIAWRPHFESAIGWYYWTDHNNPLLIFFLIGSAFSFLQAEKRINARIALAALICFAYGLVHTHYLRYMLYGCLPVLVIYLAYAKIPKLSNFGKYGDFSYGIYLSAFPIQQSLIHCFPALMPPILFAWSALLSTSFAALSWNFIEKPALAWKNRSIWTALKKLLPSKLKTAAP